MKPVCLMVIVALVLSLGMVVLPAGEVRAQGADVFIDPIPKDVVPLETFTVNVDIIPAEPTAGAQFDMSFDQSLLTCTGVAEGDLYDQGPGTTYWMPPAIDNGAGTITGAACSIIGTGVPVSNPGTFATISFTAKDVLGTSPLNFSTVGVADPTPAWLPITVTDGSVTVVEINISGTTGEVNCDTLSDVTVTLYQDDSQVGDPVYSDVDGNYTLPVPAVGDYEARASKDGYREERQQITITDPAHTLDFRGNYGLIPETGDMSYFLHCMNLYLEDWGECNIDMPKFLAVMNAYLSVW